MHEDESTHEHAPEEDLLDLNEVMQAFGIQEWSNLGPAETSQAHSLGLLVGIQGKPYILRERPEGLLDEELDHRYHFQQYLQQAGIPIPSLWLAPDQQPVVAIGDESFELQEWPGGEQFTSSDALALNRIKAGAAMLAQVHLASAHYTGAQHHWPSEVHMGAQVQGWLNLARSKAEESEIQAISSALSNWVEQYEALLPKAMMAIGAGRNGLPAFHIHGDYHPHNLRFSAGAVKAVMGLEASHWEKRIFEVAYALFTFTALSWQPGEALTRPLVKRGLDPASARAFLEAYAEIYPPAPGEADLLVDALLLIAPMTTINGPLEDLFYTQVEGLQIEEVMERLSWAASLPAWLMRVRQSLADMWI